MRNWILPVDQQCIIFTSLLGHGNEWKFMTLNPLIFYREADFGI